jgi:hypothetical protein
MKICRKGKGMHRKKLYPYFGCNETLPLKGKGICNKN